MPSLASGASSAASSASFGLAARARSFGLLGPGDRVAPALEKRAFLARGVVDPRAGFAPAFEKRAFLVVLGSRMRSKP